MLGGGTRPCAEDLAWVPSEEWITQKCLALKATQQLMEAEAAAEAARVAALRTKDAAAKPGTQAAKLARGPGGAGPRASLAACSTRSEARLTLTLTPAPTLALALA